MYHIPGRLTRRVSTAVLNPSVWLADLVARQRDRAFLFAPVALGTGIGCYFLLKAEPAIWAVTTLVVLSGFALIVLRRTWLRPVCMGLLLMALGLSAALLRTETVSAPILPAEIGPAQLIGEVVDIERRPERTRLLVRPESFGGLNADDLPHRLKISVRAMDRLVQPGDRIQMLVKAQPPSSPAEPGAFDFQRHAFFRGIGGYGYALGTAKVTVADDPEQAFNGFRDRLSSHIADIMPQSSGGIAAALIVGDRSRVTEAQQQALRDSGLAHLLAISGLHMGLVTGFLFVGLRALLALFPGLTLRRPVKKWAACAALLGGLGYLVLTGGSVPTLRAFVMVGLVMLAVVADRRAISLRTVAVAALVILAITPEALIEPGFQMSFAAVTALVATYEGFGTRWTTRDGSGVLDNKVARYLIGVALTTVIAGLATGPFAIYHFNRFADYSVLGNLAAIPVVAFWVMPMATLGALLMPLGLEWVALQGMGLGIDVVMWIADEVAALPGAVRLVPAMPAWGPVAISGGGLALFLLRGPVRFLGLLPIALGLGAPHVIDAPLVRLDASARIMAVRSADGGLMLSNQRKQKFTTGQWLARDGLTKAERWPGQGASDDGRLRCDSTGCVLRVDGWMVALPSTTEAALEDCRRADVVLSLEPIPGRCPSARVIADRFDIWRDGAHVLWLSEGKSPVIRSVNGERGRRAWIPAPVARKDQYWRNRAANRP